MPDPVAADGRAGITADLVRRLIAEQFPQWSSLPVSPVAFDGWDNRTYRLGDDMTVRLPTAERYVAGIEKENRWLPVLAPRLPVSVPTPLATGVPSAEYPYPWSVRRWLPGNTATYERVNEPGFAVDVGEFLRALQVVDASGGPEGGAHSFFRGASLRHYDDETRDALISVAEIIDAVAARDVWNAALDARWTGPPTWFHGDIAVGNLLVRGGRLAAVIDFGTCGVGDPACDLVIAWTFFSGESRQEFARVVDADAGMWARARGWALWKALITLAGDPVGDAYTNRALIEDLLADPGGDP